MKGIHHLGLAVEDLDDAVSNYERLFGAAVSGRQTSESQGVEAVALHVGDGHVELMRPLGPDTPVGRFLAKRGPGMHHVAYEVEDLPGELARLQHEGAELIDAEPRPGLFGMQVAFIHPNAANGVLSELVAAALPTPTGEAGGPGTEGEHLG